MSGIRKEGERVRGDFGEVWMDGATETMSQSCFTFSYTVCFGNTVAIYGHASKTCGTELNWK